MINIIFFHGTHVSKHEDHWESDDGPSVHPGESLEWRCRERNRRTSAGFQLLLLVPLETGRPTSAYNERAGLSALWVLL